MSPDRPAPEACALCGKPLLPGTDAVLEDGAVVHVRCMARRVAEHSRELGADARALGERHRAALAAARQVLARGERPPSAPEPAGSDGPFVAVHRGYFIQVTADWRGQDWWPRVTVSWEADGVGHTTTLAGGRTFPARPEAEAAGLRLALEWIAGRGQT
jgi:hypothetical protein